MVRQMLFLYSPDHTRLRTLASAAFTPRRAEQLRSHIQEVMDTLLDAVVAKGSMDVIADFASPAPAIVTAGAIWRARRSTMLSSRNGRRILPRCGEFSA